MAPESPHEVLHDVGPVARDGPGCAPVAAAGAPVLEVEWLGRVKYADGLALQSRLVDERRAGRITDRLLLLEHPHVITMGTSARAGHVLLDDAQRHLLGIELHEVGRGGDVTYHGPGQLVGYPILALEEGRRDLHAYVRGLEEAIIRSLSDFGVRGTRIPGSTGVWVDGRKIAAIGVRVSHGWITSHGFALNVSTDLSFFDAIVPCGIPDRGVTSLHVCTQRIIALAAAADSVSFHIAAVFGRAPSLPSAKTSRKT